MAVRTHLIMPVPAAEPVVGAYRERLDPSAAQGVPAHISVLVPFLELDALGPPELRDLEALFAAAAPIEFRLARVARFPHVLYLAPEPAAPFVELTEAVWRRWPAHPPYEGEFDDIVPHLTVAVGEGPFDHLGRALEARLPIVTTATQVWLIADVTPGAWTRQHSFGLGAGGA